MPASASQDVERGNTYRDRETGKRRVVDEIYAGFTGNLCVIYTRSDGQQWRVSLKSFRRWIKLHGELEAQHGQ